MRHTKALCQLGSTGFRTAILHQGGPVPAVGGVVKPFKPGGYTDSGADLAYNLRAAGEKVVTPVAEPIPTRDSDWSFPDTIAGVRSAVKEHGADVLWANTTLHAKHAIVELAGELRNVRMIGQSPLNTEKYEDKEWINRWLRGHSQLNSSFPKSILYGENDGQQVLEQFPLPAVAKPVRGRGSHGVTLVETVQELKEAANKLLKESNSILIEEYLEGEEITITVMPPGEYSIVGRKADYWSLPVVTRFNHQHGIAPYNGVVAVTANSRAVSAAEHASDKAYTTAQNKCEEVARLCHATAPIRVDCRRRSKLGGEIILFDVNMKPNATGPGRPGRDEQASLTTMAAEEIGWDYQALITNILRQAKLISEVLKIH
ncbi:hypothetical protein I317_07705 [Kwoniella heveanensis CBS 569]|uniref:ATP-grasp domain-containing protein n=1 Tax=Kwoniella heveanensis BCC8398 TaxID=1296120 RepID=A0A1B9GKC2_9TREE|nr:hypothetical protein I316_06840 [Kwoniella heveanensis BCC8398]OCF38524.1 hypothetical protein I317_07705 [Kwoniella heveanensis CBS 569]